MLQNMCETAATDPNGYSRYLSGREAGARIKTGARAWRIGAGHKHRGTADIEGQRHSRKAEEVLLSRVSN